MPGRAYLEDLLPDVLDGTVQPAHDIEEPMLTANAYAATAPTEPLTATTIDRRDLGPSDVLIEIR